ncbi:MAG: bifunctional 3-(3-hydroxy-phenyl)propionate/3-hydroxycinnamic acid hydroxylase [Terricaulis sp.]
MNSSFPPMTGFNQPDVDRVLSAACEAHPNIALHRGWNATRVTQAEGHACATFIPADDTARSGDEITATARFIVGCDGANSLVRSQMDADLTDTGFSSSWLVVDILPSAELYASIPFGQVLDPARPTTLAPAGKDRRRFEFMLIDGDDPALIAEEQSVWSLVGTWGVTQENATIVRRAIYTFHGRWAERWRDGRLLLAGDAAHQMPPFMGQGFNSGIRDANALAWRIDLVLSGYPSRNLLDSYTSERLPHVKQIVESSVALGRLICVTNPEAAQHRNAKLRMSRDNPQEAPPQPDWRLGRGIFAKDDPTAGFVARQARVANGDAVGLLDDVTGPGHFVLLGNGIDPLEKASPAARDAWTQLDGRTFKIGEGGLRDVDGAYAAWFDRLGRDIVLIRPDFQVYGTSNDAEPLILALQRQLNAPLSTAHQERR